MTRYAPKKTAKAEMIEIGQEHAKDFTDLKNMQAVLFNGIFTDLNGRHYAKLISIDHMGSCEYQLPYLKDSQGIFIGDPDNTLEEFKS